MPQPANLAKAKLVQLNEDLTNVLPGGKTVTVQFNPESLKLSFANQIVTPTSGGNSEGGSGRSGSGSTGNQSAGTASRQYVGAGTTKLALQLWFDVTAPGATDVIAGSGQTGAPIDDVRRLTQEVVFFMTTSPSQREPTQLVPPGVQFQWGAFTFDGVVDSLEESLEYFSDDGRPLRASLALTLSQQKILVQQFDAATQPNGLPGVGTQPLTVALAGATVQGLATSQGRGDDWQQIAAANGIENPRRLQPGQLLNLNLR